MEINLMALLVGLIIFGLLFYVVRMLPLPAPFGRIVEVVLVVFLCLWLLQIFFGVLGTGPILQLRTTP